MGLRKEQPVYTREFLHRGGSQKPWAWRALGRRGAGHSPGEYLEPSLEGWKAHVMLLLIGFSISYSEDPSKEHIPCEKNP